MKYEIWNMRYEIRNMKSEVVIRNLKYTESEFQNLKIVIRKQESEIRNPKSANCNLKSGI